MAGRGPVEVLSAEGVGAGAEGEGGMTGGAAGAGEGAGVGDWMMSGLRERDEGEFCRLGSPTEPTSGLGVS